MTVINEWNSVFGKLAVLLSRALIVTAGFLFCAGNGFAQPLPIQSGSSGGTQADTIVGRG